MDPTAIESEPEPRLVNCYQVHDIEVHASGLVAYRALAGADGDPERALADALKAKADGLLIIDVRTGERWYVPCRQVRTIADWASIRHLQQLDAWHRDQGHVICWCGRWYTQDELDRRNREGTCGADSCLAAEAADRAGLVP